MALRAIKVIYSDGTEYTTSMAAGLSDEQMLNYFAIGRVFNLGTNCPELIEDNLQAVVSRKIVR